MQQITKRQVIVLHPQAVRS